MNFEIVQRHAACVHFVVPDLRSGTEQVIAMSMANVELIRDSPMALD